MTKLLIVKERYRSFHFPVKSTSDKSVGLGPDKIQREDLFDLIRSKDCIIK